VSRSIAVVSVVSLADTVTTTPKPSSEEQQFRKAVHTVSNQAEQPLPQDGLHPFTVAKAKAKTNLRRLSEDPQKVRMQTWGRHQLPQGVQKYTGWYTLETEFYPKLASMAAAISNKYELNKAGLNSFRADLSSQTNRLLGMSVDKDVEKRDIRFIYSADIIIEQAEPKDGTPTNPNPGFFRPCMESPRIDRNSCSFDEKKPQGTYPWIQNWIKTAWDTTPEGIKNAYPFTGEGYTFDFNKESKTHIGLQEYVVPKFGSSLDFRVPNDADPATVDPDTGLIQGTPIIKALCAYCKKCLKGNCPKDTVDDCNTVHPAQCSIADSLVIV
jgi:hypothetical protein